MDGLGCKIGEVTVAFNDMTPEAWGRVQKYANTVVLEIREDGTEVRAGWLDFLAWPMRDPIAARMIHEEAVRVAEPQSPDPVLRSKELAGTITALNESFVAVVDDIPTLVDGVPKAEDVPSTSGSAG